MARPRARTVRTLSRRGLLGCAIVAGPTPARASAPVILGGTGSATGLLRDLTERHAALSGQRYHLVPSLGSAGGLRALAAGRLDIALTIHDPGAGDGETAPRRQVLGRTAVVLATQGASPPRMLTSAEAARLLTGQDRAWPDGTPARLAARPPFEREWHALRQGPDPMARVADAAAQHGDAVISATAQDNAAALATIEGSIGLITLGQVMTERPAIRIVAVDGVVPGSDALRDGTWPYAVTLYAITRADAAPAVDAFLAFLAGPVAAARMAQLGYLPAGEAA